MRGLLSALLLAVAGPAFAQDANAFIGTWKLLSQQAVVEGQAPQDTYGANPRGYLIATKDRIMVLITAPNRKAGSGDAERAALHRTMVAATGKYRLDGNVLSISFDASWNEAWNGTEQKRILTFEGDRMIAESPPIPSTLQPGKTMVLKLVFERGEMSQLSVC